MEKAVGIGLFALLVVGVAFVQVHYYRERQRAKAECERLEQSIGQMQKQYVDVVKQNQSYRQMNHELKKYQWLVQVMRENMGTVTHGQLLELVLQKKIQEAEHKQITCDVQGTLNGNLRMDEMSLVSLVMNLLDNAIEACVQTETRQIQVVIAEDPAAQMLELKLQNSKNSSQKLHANESHEYGHISYSRQPRSLPYHSGRSDNKAAKSGSSAGYPDRNNSYGQTYSSV